MKKILSVLLIFIIVFSVSGCISDKNLNDFLNQESQIQNFINDTNDTGINNINDIKAVEIKEIDDKKLTNNSYYRLLNSEQKLIYRKLYSICYDMTEGFVQLEEMNKNSYKNVILAYNALIFDIPEIFWMPNTYIFGTMNNGQKESIAIAFEFENENNKSHYNISKTDLKKYKDELDNNVQKIVLKVNECSSEFEKVKCINDYLCNNVIYETNGALSNTVYGAIVSGEAICEGYSKAFSLLCHKVGIKSEIVVGESHDEGHMWNQVEIDGKWSFVDVTWSDTENGISYEYFNVPMNIIQNDHTFSKLFTEFSNEEIASNISMNFKIEDCNTLENTVYYKYDQIITNNLSKVAKKIISENDNGVKSIEFMFDDEKELEKFNMDNNSYLQKIQDYMTEPLIVKYSLNFNILTILWK